MDKLDNALSFHESALRIRAQRQELLAANIANADTPNYKARDFDFASALKNAMSGTSSSTVSPTKTSEMHMGSSSDTPSIPSQSGDIQYRNTVQGSVDGNTVDMDVERNQFADNAIRYEASLIMINGQIKKMLAAIQGQ